MAEDLERDPARAGEAGGDDLQPWGTFGSDGLVIRRVEDPELLEIARDAGQDAEVIREHLHKLKRLWLGEKGSPFSMGDLLLKLQREIGQGAVKRLCQKVKVPWNTARQRMALAEDYSKEHPLRALGLEYTIIRVLNGIRLQAQEGEAEADLARRVDEARLDWGRRYLRERERERASTEKKVWTEKKLRQELLAAGLVANKGPRLRNCEQCKNTFAGGIRLTREGAPVHLCGDGCAIAWLQVPVT